MKSIRIQCAVFRVLCVLGMMGVSMDAAVLEVGSPAPSLHVSEWIQGSPVLPPPPSTTPLEKTRQVWVIDFWATWCGPCKATIPHLNQLQRNFAERHPTYKLQIVGVTEETAAKVKPFVTAMGSNMTYAVGLDREGQTTRDYMGGFGVRTIPHAFVVDGQGRIVWHGHALGQLRQVLDEVVQGTWDVAKAKRVIRAEDALQRYLVLAATSPTSPETQRLGQSWLQDAWDSPELLNNGASALLTHPRLPQRDWRLARDAAERAVHLSQRKDAAMLDTLASALAGLKDRSLAAQIQQEAIDKAPDQSSRDQYQKRLREYQKSSVTDR